MSIATRHSQFRLKSWLHDPKPPRKAQQRLFHHQTHPTFAHLTLGDLALITIPLFDEVSPPALFFRNCSRLRGSVGSSTCRDRLLGTEQSVRIEFVPSRLNTYSSLTTWPVEILMAPVQTVPCVAGCSGTCAAKPGLRIRATSRGRNESYEITDPQLVFAAVVVGCGSLGHHGAHSLLSVGDGNPTADQYTIAVAHSCADPDSDWVSTFS